MFYFIRRKKILSREKNEVQFDTTAIADLSFNLLIFFIVTASFMLRQGIFLSLPSADSASVKIEEKQIFDIYPDNNGYVAGDAFMTRADVMGLLKSRNETVKDVVAVIHMKPEVKYDRLVDSLSLVRESGVAKVSLKDR